MSAPIEIPGSSGFFVETDPPTAGVEHHSTVRLSLHNRGRSRLSGPGVSAVLGVFAAYFTAAKANDIVRLAGAHGSSQHCRVSPEGAAVDVLAVDVPSLISSLKSTLNNPANITV